MPSRGTLANRLAAEGARLQHGGSSPPLVADTLGQLYADACSSRPLLPERVTNAKQAIRTNENAMPVLVFLLVFLPGTTQVKATEMSGLRTDSVALAFQIRAIDRSRIKEQIGTVTPAELAEIQEVGKQGQALPSP